MITLSADSYWLRDSQPLITQKRHVGISAFSCVFVSVSMYLIGFKVLVAKLDEMFQWAVVVDL